MALRKLDTTQQLTGPGWTATRKNGAVTIVCASMQPDITFTLPVGWRPAIQCETPVHSGVMRDGVAMATIKVGTDGVVSTVRAESRVWGVMTYVTA